MLFDNNFAVLLRNEPDGLEMKRASSSSRKCSSGCDLREHRLPRGILLRGVNQYHKGCHHCLSVRDGHAIAFKDRIGEQLSANVLPILYMIS